MEALRNETVHTPDSMHSLSCIATHLDDLSKEKEDELLYGAGDDGDEEDALSDDSMRLRLSDDDDEAELPSIIDETPKLKDKKIEVTSAESEDMQVSPVPEKKIIGNDSTAREKSEEDRYTDVSSKNEPDTSIKCENSTNTNNGKCNALDSECSSIGTDKDTANSNEVEKKDLADSKTEILYEESFINISCINNTLEVQRKVIIAQESSKTIPPSNNVECNDITTIGTNTFNESSREKNTNSLINSHDNNKEIIKGDKTSTDHVDSDCNDLDNSNNFNILEKLLTDGTKCKSDDDDIIECTTENTKSNEKQNEMIQTEIDSDANESERIKRIPTLEKHELNKSHQAAETNHRIESIEDNSNSLIGANITSTNSIVKEEVTRSEKDVSVRVMTSNEENKDNVLKTDTTKLNELSTVEGDKEIEVIQNNMLSEPLTNGVQCDKDQLNDSDNSTNAFKLFQVLLVPEERLINSKISLQEHRKDIVDENTKSIEKESAAINSATNISKPTENIGSALAENNSPGVNSHNVSLGLVIDIKDNSGDCDSDKKVVGVPVTTKRRRRRTKKKIAAAQEAACDEDKQVKESGRQKRRTAKNAEEIIRKKYLNHDSDLESSDGSEKFVIVNHKINQDARPLSPPSLKRNFTAFDGATVNGSVKKVKMNCETPSNELVVEKNNLDNVKKLDYVHKFFRRDLKEKLPKLTQEELEELLIQKIVETITMRGEIGKLREQARISERNQEVTRAKCQQLAKQIKDFEMVLSRNAADRRANNDKPIPPIKINRSVGLQVNFITDHGMQNLRQLQQNCNMKPLPVSNSSNTPNTSSNETNNGSSPRRGIKVRSPRRSEPAAGQQAVGVSQNHTQSPNIMPTITPAALVVAKPVDTQHTLTLPTQSNVQQIISTPQSQQPTQTVVLNGKFTNQINRQNTTVAIAKSRTSDLIDLTDEEEKSKVAANVPVVTTTITDQQINLAQKTQSCFQRVIQTIPGNVAITSQPPSIRVVQPASQPTPTALVNNMNAPRLAYVMQSGVGPTRQLLITPNSNPMRPVTSCNRASFSTVTYKPGNVGISTVANGTVRVLTTSATAPAVQLKHPAPLPDTRKYNTLNPSLKLPPPAPSLKISKTSNGIVLSWNMSLSDKHADIASYQLYAYQEVAGISPSMSLWKKVGDVRALPLPMACTLTQFSEGNNYYFAVRAVDTHSRKGQYSTPGNISL